MWPLSVEFTQLYLQMPAATRAHLPFAEDGMIFAGSWWGFAKYAPKSTCPCVYSPPQTPIGSGAPDGRKGLDVDHTSGIFFIPDVGPGERRSLRFLDLASRRTRVVHTFDRPVMWGLSATRDGRSVLYTRVDHWGSDLKLIENIR